MFIYTKVKLYFKLLLNNELHLGLNYLSNDIMTILFGSNLTTKLGF